MGVYIPFVLCVSILTSYCVCVHACVCRVQERAKRREMIAELDMKADVKVSQKAQKNDHKDMANNACIKYGIRHNTMTCQMVKKVLNAPRAFLPHDSHPDQAALLPPDSNHDMLYPVDESAKGHAITSAICHSRTIAAWIAIAQASVYMRSSCLRRICSYDGSSLSARKHDSKVSRRYSHKPSFWFQS